ncbi:hypothetical protein [Dictyobacter alpinus]|uniref:hypothetical protein n=1 Tax=Dictyobacter alpinus TaxID=2014873 RepID=UPI001386EBFE|nr:hypothetical protein [Dictyobacter alpinus]
MTVVENLTGDPPVNGAEPSLVGYSSVRDQQCTHHDDECSNDNGHKDGSLHVF